MIDVFDTVSPEWIQQGELGIAFVTLILFSFLVYHITKSSDRRESFLLEQLKEQNAEMRKVTTILQSLVDRIGNIEETLQMPPANCAVNISPPKVRRVTQRVDNAK